MSQHHSSINEENPPIGDYPLSSNSMKTRKLARIHPCSTLTGGVPDMLSPVLLAIPYNAAWLTNNAS